MWPSGPLEVWHGREFQQVAYDTTAVRAHADILVVPFACEQDTQLTTLTAYITCAESTRIGIRFECYHVISVICSGGELVAPTPPAFHEAAESCTSSLATVPGFEHTHLLYRLWTEYTRDAQRDSKHTSLPCCPCSLFHGDSSSSDR